MIGPRRIREHREVVGSDGNHVGTVANLVIELTNKDLSACGQHHLVKLDTLAAIENGKLTLDVPASEAVQLEQPLGSQNPTPTADMASDRPVRAA